MHKYEDFKPQRIKHLEMIQTVVERLVTLEFFVKGWVLSIFGLFLGLAINKEEPWLAIASLLPTLMFGWFEMYLLTTERQFRALSNHVADFDDRLGPFFMRATKRHFQQHRTKTEKEETAPKAVLFSPAIGKFYLALVVLTFVAAIGIHFLFRHDSRAAECETASQALVESAALEHKALIRIGRAVLKGNSASLRRAEDLTLQASESVGKAEALANACASENPSPTQSP